MTSVRESIILETAVILNGLSKPMGIPDARVRRPVPEGPITAPQINVYFAAEDNEVKGGRHGPLTQHRIRLVIEARAVTADPDEVDLILEPYLVWISKSMANSDNLNRWATDVVELGTVWTPFYMEKIYAVARVSFLIEYQTNRKNPESRS